MMQMAGGMLMQVGMGLLKGIVADNADRERVRLHNAAALKQNRMNLAATEQASRALDLQQSALQIQVRKATEMAQASANATAGSAGATAAAGGVMGISIDAVQGEIERDYQERQYELVSQRDAAQVDTQLQRELLFQQYHANMTQLTTRQKGLIGAGIVGGAMNAASTYASSYFSMGASGG